MSYVLHESEGAGNLSGLESVFLPIVQVRGLLFISKETEGT